MQRNRVVVAFRKAFDRKPNFEDRHDLILATALVWTLGCMEVNFSNNELLFDVDYGYIFSKQLKMNLDTKTNLIHDYFTEEDLKKIEIVKESLLVYKKKSIKERVFQASACYSALRTVASERSVNNEFSNLCPEYEALQKQAYLNYTYIYNTYHKYYNDNQAKNSIENEEITYQ